MKVARIVTPEQVTEKPCKDCGKVKPLEDFAPSKMGKYGRKAHCRKCLNASVKKHRETHPRKIYSYPYNKEQGRVSARLSDMKTKYGISPEIYASILEEQGGVCAICKQVRHACSGAWPLVIDHDHKTGKVRGLLCNLCNQALGRFHDDPEILARALDYLTSGPCNALSSRDN